MPEKRVIRLGYVETDYPYVAKCDVGPRWSNCSDPGINMMIWRELAFRFNYELVFVKSESYGSLINGEWTGLMGDLYNGTIDATLALLVLSSERWNASQFSEPVIMGEFGLARGFQRGADDYQFQVFVFDPLVLLYLFISILLVGCIVAYRLQSIHGFWNAFAWLSQKTGSARHFRNPLIIFAFLVILLFYQAGANTQRMNLKISSSRISLATIRRRLLSGNMRLLLAYPTVIDEVYTDRLMQRTGGDILDLNPILEPDEERRIEILCETSDTITFGELRGLLSSKFRPQNCAIERVKVTETFEALGPMAFGFARNFSSPQLKQINAIIGRIFTVDILERYWFPQYDYIMVETSSLSEQISALSAMTLRQLRFGYAFLAGGVALSCIAFAVEKVSFRFCENLNCALIRINRSA